MNPLRFQCGPRDLYGLLSPPAKASAPAQAVVFCNPLGQEAIRTHRLYRVLAERVAAAGFAVLRFDYYATGDSAGDVDEADPAEWVEDILAACDLLRARTGCREVSLFGMRLGANLALRAATQLVVPAPSLLLWDPIVDGERYLKELQQAHREALAGTYSGRWSADAGLRARHTPPDDSEALGFPLTATLVAGLANIHLVDELRQAASSASRILLWSDDAEAAAAGQPRAEPLGVAIDWKLDEALNTAIAPVEVVRTVVAALGGRRGT